jgi:hypothetical protein
MLWATIDDADPYSITWSARASTDGGIANPSVLTVFRLMTKSKCVGCSTGRSAGLAPLRLLSTCPAACRNSWGVIDTVRHEAAGQYKVLVAERRQAALGREIEQPHSVRQEERVVRHEHRGNALPAHRREHAAELGGPLHGHGYEL